MGDFIRNEACPECSTSGRGHSLSIYTDGVYCNECGYSTRKDGEEVEKPIEKKLCPLIPIGEYKAISSRNISLETAKKFKCTITTYNDEPVICMSYYHRGAIVAQKLKFKKNSKHGKYKWLGDKSKVAPLWGMNLWQPNEKISITICEGETDMLCRSTLNEDKWPVVSLVDGAGGQSIKSIAKAKEYLLGFKHINIMLDGDKTGRDCAEKIAQLLGSKARIVQMPDNEDVCSMVQKGRGSELSRLEMLAVGVRPNDIVTVNDYTDEELYSVEGVGIGLPFPKLNILLRGLKHSSLYMFCSGAGMGKSSVVKEIAYDLMFNKHIKVGCIFLEQGDKEAMKDYIAMDHQIEAEDFNQNPDLLTKEQRDKSKGVLAQYGVFYKHFGSLDCNTLISKIEYMMEGCDCDFVILDHISMAVSGNSSALEGERKQIDILMTNLRTTIQKTGKSVIAVSHLKRQSGEGRDYNNGGVVNLSALRGSASIEQISDYVIGLERNQFSEKKSNQLKLKVLKCRRGGKIGYADVLDYSYDTGRLSVKKDDQTLDKFE